MKINPDERLLLTKQTLGSSVKTKQLKKEDHNKCKRILKKIVEGKVVTVILSLVTVYALIGDDIRLWVTTKEADPYFFVGLLISLLLFTAEILINTLVIEDFKYSFFFWLDIIATISIIPDVSWVMDALVLVFDATPSYKSVNVIPGKIIEESVASSKIQKVVKSLRLIRLIRIIKLYKYIIQSKNKKETPEETSKYTPRKSQYGHTDTEENEQSNFMKETDPSKLGKALSDTITRRVIIGVLLMLMVLPLLSFSEIDFSAQYGLRELFWFGRSNCNQIEGDFFCESQNNSQWLTTEGWNEMLRSYVNSSKDSEDSSLSKQLLWLYIPDFNSSGRLNNITQIPRSPHDEGGEGFFWQQEDSCAGFTVSDDCPWRYEEMQLYQYTPFECTERDRFGNHIVKGCDQVHAYSRFNRRVEKEEEAIFQFLTTLFTCFVLTIASLTFSNDTQQIVIKPIQKIVKIIQTLAENPLKKAQPPHQEEEEKGHMRTQMLENTIFKISTLLQRGFGELGAEIISKYFSNSDQYLDLMKTGRKQHIIFSFLRIRQFTETTESLQDEIIVFVNKIVKIVHECTKKWNGAPTKNFGEKYLLTWRLPYNKNYDDVIRVEGLEDSSNNQEGALRREVGNIKFMNNQVVPEDDISKSKAEFSDEEPNIDFLIQKRQSISEKSFIAAVKIIAELRRAQDLQAYSRHPKIAPKFGQNYRTKITFGLHLGTGIVGAIGSEFKIDALYLSTDCKIAEKIESLCEDYDVNILLSDKLQKQMGEQGQKQLRKIDNVSMDINDQKPLELYTYDMVFSDENENIGMYNDSWELGAILRHKEFAELQGEIVEKEAEENVENLEDENVYEIDHDFMTLKPPLNQEFEDLYSQAYQAYVNGEWTEAQKNIDSCLEIKSEYGPLIAIKEYLEKNKFVPPEGWKGYRNLDEKDPLPSMDFIRQDYDEDIGEDNDIDDNQSLI